MAQLEVSAGGRDPRISDYVLREDIATTDSSGQHVGASEIPLGVKIEAVHIEVVTAISGGSVYTLEVGIGNDGAVYFPSGSTRSLSAGSTLFGIFEYSNVNLFDGRGPDPGRRFLVEDNLVYSTENADDRKPIRKASIGTLPSENTARVVLYTKAIDGEVAATTAGSVRVTVYGRRYNY